MALTLSDKVLVLVGSAQVSGTKRNPFSADLRTAILKDVYKFNPRVKIGTINDLSNEDDISEEWGIYLLKTATEYLGEKPKLMVYGNDDSRSQWFQKDELSDISELIVKRDGISATSLRYLMFRNDKSLWRVYVPYAVWKYYDLMRNQLFEIYKRIGEENV
jgi:nicotinamide-nucleotide adenylyltransferase